MRVWVMALSNKFHYQIHSAHYKYLHCSFISEILIHFSWFMWDMYITQYETKTLNLSNNGVSAGREVHNIFAFNIPTAILKSTTMSHEKHKAITKTLHGFVFHCSSN